MDVTLAKMQMRYEFMYEGPQLDGQKYGELIKPVVAMVLISAMAAARFDCDWENVFVTQVKETT
jgi:hypothetical protein